MTVEQIIEREKLRAEIARLTYAIESWKAEEQSWKEREAELFARLVEAEKNLETFRVAEETPLQIGRDAEEARLRYATGDPARTWADPDWGGDV